MRMVALLVVPSVGLQLSGPRDASSIDRMAQLWDGIDVEGLHFNDTGLGAPGCPSCTSLALSTGLPKFQILGMFDTGTNLLGELMAANFGREAFGRMCPEFAKGEGFDCYFDKHRPPQDVDPRGLHIVALVRSPLASIAAWRKAPYDLETCFESVDWLHDHDANCSVGKKKKMVFFRAHGGMERLRERISQASRIGPQCQDRGVREPRAEHGGRNARHRGVHRSPDGGFPPVRDALEGPRGRNRARGSSAEDPKHDTYASSALVTRGVR